MEEEIIEKKQCHHHLILKINLLWAHKKNNYKIILENVLILLENKFKEEKESEIWTFLNNMVKYL